MTKICEQINLARLAPGAPVSAAHMIVSIIDLFYVRTWMKYIYKDALEI